MVTEDLMFESLNWHDVLVPLGVFLAETCVVSLSTVRILFVGRGLKLLAAILGFCEVSLWLLAIGQVMTNLTSVPCFVAFGSGFALGNYLGIWLEQKLAIGALVVRIITNHDAGELCTVLRAANCGVTSIDGQGATGAVQVLFTVINRKDYAKVLAMIEQCHPKAFVSVEDVRSARAGVFPMVRPGPLALLQRNGRKAA
jgi:uncharacterized protein YebE (UPF0316 family)